MSPLWVNPPAVTTAAVRRLTEGVADEATQVQHVAVPTVPAAHAVPRQLDPAALRLMALQLENDRLRAELEQLRAS
jgi:hypothetical protein